MKVGMSRKRLERALYNSLYEINLTRNNKNEVVNKLLAKGLPSGEIQKIIGGNIALEFIGEIRLGAIAQAVFEVTDDELINPENYYDEKEMEQIKNYKEEIESEEISYPLVFDNMIQLSSDKWVGKISIDYLVKLVQSNKIDYNFETQRDPKYVKYKDGVIKRPNINPVSVIEIVDLMVADQYDYDDVTLNILNNGSEKYQYDTKNNRLIVFSGDINLTDGAHREKAAEIALLRRPDIEGYFILIITNYDVDKANNYIIQKDKRNPLSTEFKEAKDTASLANDVVKRLNENTRSDIRGLIVTDEMLLKEGFGLTYFSIMSKTIDELWDIKTRKDVRIISNYLIEFFNELIGTFPDELKLNIKENQGKNFINHRNMFIFYLALAKELEGVEDWEDILEDFIDSIDFSLENEYFNNTIKGLTPNNIDKRLTSTITAHKNEIQDRMRMVI